jgi:hypothetical protein
VAELTGGRLLWHKHKELIPRYKWSNSGDGCVKKYLTYVRIFWYMIHFLIACFINSSSEVTFRIAFEYNYNLSEKWRSLLSFCHYFFDFGGPGFKSRPEHRLYWQRLFVALFDPSRKCWNSVLD